jgi:tetratricopeptide (TPR) repeat protein
VKKMRSALRHVVCLASVLLLPWLAAQANTASPQVDAAAEKRQLTVASAMILARQPERALTEILNPLIARYNTAYPPTKDLIFSTSDEWESALLIRSSAAHGHKASVVESTWADAYRMKSAALIELGRLEEAQNALVKAIGLSPLDAGHRNELAFTYQAQKNFAEATRSYERAAALATLHPESPKKSDQLRRAWRGQAFVLIERGQLDEAEALYERCLSLEPNDRGAQQQLAFIAWRRQNSDPQQVVSCTQLGVEGGVDKVPGAPVRCRK